MGIDKSIIISVACDTLAVLGIAAQPFIHQSATWSILASTFFLFGGISGGISGVVGVRNARQSGKRGIKVGTYSAGLGIFLGLVAYAAFMLQLHNFSRQL